MNERGGWVMNKKRSPDALWQYNVP